MSLHHCGLPDRDYDELEDPFEGLWGKCGAAVEDCLEHEDGTLWVDNGEYASRVNYCPFCGYSTKEKITKMEFSLK